MSLIQHSEDWNSAVSFWIFIKEQSSIGSKTNGIGSFVDRDAFGFAYSFSTNEPLPRPSDRATGPNQETIETGSCSCGRKSRPSRAMSLTMIGSPKSQPARRGQGHEAYHDRQHQIEARRELA